MSLLWPAMIDSRNDSEDRKQTAINIRTWKLNATISVEFQSLIGFLETSAKLIQKSLSTTWKIFKSRKYWKALCIQFKSIEMFKSECKRYDRELSHDWRYWNHFHELSITRKSIGNGWKSNFILDFRQKRKVLDPRNICVFVSDDQLLQSRSGEAHLENVRLSILLGAEARWTEEVSNGVEELWAMGESSALDSLY